MSGFLTIIKNSAIVNGLRTITATMFGPADVKATAEAAPFGYDGSPIAGLNGLYLKTTNRSRAFFIGFINTNQKAQPGEVRIYATDARGNEVVKTWLHNSGDLEIGGTSSVVNPNHLTQWEALKTALDNYFTVLNANVNTGITGLGGLYVTPPPIVLEPAKAKKLLIE